MKDFFVSYTKADCAWAEWIAYQLEEAEYTTVLQVWDFRPGSNFPVAMSQAVEETERTIAVLSPEYLTSEFAQSEWAATFRHDPKGTKGKLLPVKVRECDPKGLLGPVVYVDLLGLKESAAKETLLGSVRRGRSKPKATPAFPGVSAARSVVDRPRFPGALPPLWNVPHHRNPNFTGREIVLAALHKGLVSGETQAIVGLGGLGKTQLLVEHAYRHASDYTRVWWMRAEEPATLASAYSGLAEALDLPEKNAPDQAVQVRAVRGWLGENAGWLLVFDNAPGPTEVRDYLPQGHTGHVLATSRNPNWRGVASPISLQVLEEGEAVAFLLRRSGREDETAAAELAASLGRLPLALEQAGAYVEAASISVSNYLQLFRGKDPLQLLEEGIPSTDYSSTVAKTWQLSFQQIQKESPAGVELLNLCAFLAPDDIPRELLSEGAAFFPPSLAAAVTNPRVFSKVVVALRRYSLVEASSDSLSVHRLVQAVARDRLPESEGKACAEAAVLFISAAFPQDPTDVGNHNRCALLLPHASAALEHGKGLATDVLVRARLLDRVGVFLQSRARFPDAQRVFSDALEALEAAGETTHPVAVTVCTHLGSLLHERGDIHGAKALLEDAMRVHVERCGLESLEVAEDRFNLARIFNDREDVAGAKLLLNQVLETHIKVLGPNHRSVAKDLDLLAVVHLRSGNLVEARLKMGCAVAVYETLGQADHPEARFLRFLYDRLFGDRAVSGSFTATLRDIISASEQAYGERHPEVADRTLWLADELLSTKDSEDAAAKYEHVLEIDTDAYGNRHWRVGRDLMKLFVVNAVRDEKERAREDLLKAVEILGQNGPTEDATYRRGVATTPTFIMATFDEALDSLAAIHAATTEFVRIKDIVRDAFGTDSPLYAAVLDHLGTEQREAGAAETAKSALELALNIFKKHYGDQHVRVASCWCHLGAVQADLGDFDDAKASYERSLGILDAAQYPNHVELMRVLQALYPILVMLDGRAAAEAGKNKAEKTDLATQPAPQPPPNQAPPILQRALEVAQKAVGVESLVPFAEFLADAGKLEDARTINNQVLKIEEETFGLEHPRVATSLNRLGDVFVRLEDLPSAHRYFDRALRIHKSSSAAPDEQVAVDLIVHLSPLLAALGDSDAAILDLEEGLAILERLGGRTQTDLAALRVQSWLAVGDAALIQNMDDSQRLYECAFRRTPGVRGSEAFLARLGGLAAARGNVADAIACFTDCAKLSIDCESTDPFWTVVHETAPVARHVAGLRPFDEALVALREHRTLQAHTRTFHSPLSALLPAGWGGKTSTTLLSPDGRANVIASSEPLDATIGTERYAEEQGKLLRSKFPEYVERAFDEAQILGGRRGFIRHFEWSPPDSVPVTRIQLYCAEDGHGYTATATTSSALFPDAKVQLRGLLMALKIVP